MIPSILIYSQATKYVNKARMFFSFKRFNFFFLICQNISLFDSFEELFRDDPFALHLNVDSGVGEFSNDCDVFLAGLLSLLCRHQLVGALFVDHSFNLKVKKVIYIRGFKLKAL